MKINNNPLRPRFLAPAAGLFWSAGCANKPVRQPISETTKTSLVAYDTLRDDRDGKTYRTMVIGGKRWMAENLNYAPKSGSSWCNNNNDCYCGAYGGRVATSVATRF